MSEEEKEKIDIIETEIDPLEHMIKQWVNTKILPAVEATSGFEPGMIPGIELTLEDLAIMILNCFDDVQETMMDTIRGENETLH